MQKEPDLLINLYNFLKIVQNKKNEAKNSKLRQVSAKIQSKQRIPPSFGKSICSTCRKYSIENWLRDLSMNSADFGWTGYLLYEQEDIFWNLLM